MYVSWLTLESLVYVTVAATDCPHPWEYTLALTQYELQETTITIQHHDTRKLTHNYGTSEMISVH